ncbi:hypothetical protein ATO2_16445 [Roseovarius sp. 22II1-1F6A]|nr:hypothetical protein ATO2_16445 [Roseovarius sp. 22II1-1F6A]
MDYQVRITVGRYRRARDFLSDLAQLKAFRGEYAGPALLEGLEELGLLRPRIRLFWPDPIARRIWLETHEWAKTLHDPVEPDGPRLDAAADLSNALQDAGFKSLNARGHPFDTPRPEWREFLQEPALQSFIPHRDRRVRVSSDESPDLHDSDNVQDFYSSWQLLLAAELADMGIHIRVNMASDDVAERVRDDIQNGRWPGGRASEALSPIRALRDFKTHETTLDAIEWSREEERDRTFRLLQGLGGWRIVLNDEQIAERDEIRRSVAKEACERFSVGSDDLINCCEFLARQWHEWHREGRPLIADAYKIFLAEGVRLLQVHFEMSFAEINETIGFQGSGMHRTLEVIWPDWDAEQVERLVRTLRAPDLSEDQVREFGVFLRENFQDAIFHRLQSFEKHAFEYGHARIAGMQSDLQGMSVAVEQVVRALGGQGTQLSKMFRDLWDGTEVGRILKKQKTLLERGLPLEDLLEEIDALRANRGEHEKAADLILATRVRGSVHHAIRIENQLELEKLLVRVLRAAALTHALLKPVDAD